MENEKTGKLIAKLRKEKGYTQLNLAEKLCVSDKAVSKWERGLGCPDVSLLKSLSEIFGVSVNILLNGEIEENDMENGNMNKIKYYVCPNCQNVVTQTGNGEISCCGKKLEALKIREEDEKHKLNVEVVEDEYYVTMNHPMTKEHYVSFVAFQSFDRVTIIKTYAEQNLEMRIPMTRRGKFVYYCTKDGAYSMRN